MRPSRWALCLIVQPVQEIFTRCVQLDVAIGRLHGIIQAVSFTPSPRHARRRVRDEFDDEVEEGPAGGTGTRLAEDVDVYRGLVLLVGVLGRTMDKHEQDVASSRLADIADEIARHMPCHAYLPVFATLCQVLTQLGACGLCTDVCTTLLAEAPDPASRWVVLQAYTLVAKAVGTAGEAGMVREDIGSKVRLFVHDVQAQDGLPWRLRLGLAQCLGAMIATNSDGSAWNLPDMDKVCILLGPKAGRPRAGNILGELVLFAGGGRVSWGRVFCGT